MPTKREREYYKFGFKDGVEWMERRLGGEVGYTAEREEWTPSPEFSRSAAQAYRRPPPKKRKLSAWNKFVKANSKKPRFVLRSGKLNLKKMGVAFRKTPAGKKKRR